MNWYAKPVVSAVAKALGIGAVLVAGVTVGNLFAVSKSPAYLYSTNDVIDGYIVDAVKSDTQLYAHLPNDTSVYTLTVTAEGLPIWSFVAPKYVPTSGGLTVTGVTKAEITPDTMSAEAE